MKEANLKRLPTGRFQVYDILEKGTSMRTAMNSVAAEGRGSWVTGRAEVFQGLKPFHTML
jgi:hypothetical protein